MAAGEQSPTARLRALRPPTEPNTLVLVISGLVVPADITPLCERVRALVERSDADVVICDVDALAEPDVVAVDALARLQLIARRLGCHLRLRHACPELQDLLGFVGLRDVLPLCAELPVESRRQAEEREQPLGVEEEGDPADPPL